MPEPLRETGRASEQPSELFMDLICDGGTPSIDCQLCGRTHFATGIHNDISPEELADLNEKANKEPDKYVRSDNDSIGFGWFNGMQVVYGCPCGKLKRYEDFIWHNKHLIIRYIKARAADDAKKANDVLEELQ